MDSDVEMAHRLAGIADDISTGYFEHEPHVTLKKDGTPVSEADLAVEAALVGALSAHRPTDSVLSEESSPRKSPAPRRWILDPIDGTDVFLAGQQSWGTHIALEIDGQLQLAIITRPTAGRRWWAVRGQGAWSSETDSPMSTGTRLTVSGIDRLAQARIGGFVSPKSPIAAVIRTQAVWVADPLGDIIALVEGRVDAVLAPGGAVWDHAPQVLRTTEAGGRYTDRFGDTRIDASGGLYTNGVLDQQIKGTAGLRPSDWPD